MKQQTIQKTELPEGWELKPLNDYAKFIKGTEPGSKTYNEEGKGIRFLRVSDISGKGKKLIYTTSKKIVIANKNDILMSFDGSIGLIARGLEGGFASGIRKIKSKDEKKLLNDFLYYILKSPQIFSQVFKYARGIGIMHAGRATKHLEIPLPPLFVQQKIVKKLNSFFEKYNKLKQEKQKAKEKYERILGSVINSLIPSKDKLPEGWEMKKLKEICKVVSGSTPKTSIKEYWDGNVLWITPKDLSKFDNTIINDTQRKITKKGYESCSTTMLPKGSVLMSSRAPIGYLAIAGKDMCTNQGMKSFVCSNKIINFYLYYFLKKAIPDLKQKGSGTTFGEISRSKLEEYEMPIPSISEQKQIISKLEKIKQKYQNISEEQKKIEKWLKELPKAVLSRAFKGKLV